jgi:hypothetical protein
MMTRSTIQTIWGVIVFSIAMAALEGAVVVYLRALFYPDGFSVAFKVIDERILRVELLRELATIVMLAAVGYMTGNNVKQRLAYFLLAFATWDIFYYAWLKALIDWPLSLNDWDILFLIPFTWLGPVWAPLVCSVTMIALALVLLRDDRRVSALVWSMLIAGSLVILYTFMEDYGKIIIGSGFMKDYPQLLQNPRFLQVVSRFIPHSFNWPVFWVGEFVLLGAVICQYRGYGDAFSRKHSIGRASTPSAEAR